MDKWGEEKACQGRPRVGGSSAMHTATHTPQASSKSHQTYTSERAGIGPRRHIGGQQADREISKRQSHLPLLAVLSHTHTPLIACCTRSISSTAYSGLGGGDRTGPLMSLAGSACYNLQVLNWQKLQVQEMGPLQHGLPGLKRVVSWDG